MRTLRRLLYRDILASVAFVAVAFLSLFFFIDVVDDLDQIGSRGRTLADVLLAAALEQPGHLYELMPIAVLIGSIYSLSRMAQSSEFTILRTGGLGPGRALALLAVLGVGFGALTFAIGEVLAPASERQAVMLKARFAGGLRVGTAGAWLKDHAVTPAGERSWSVNVQGTSGSGALLGITVFEFDGNGTLLSSVEAPEGHVDAEGRWTLTDARLTHWPAPAALPSPPATPAARDDAAVPRAVRTERVATYTWNSSIDPQVVAAAVLPPATMSTLELWRYSRHLSAQEQAAQQHQIRFWRKALYPLACVVMVALALPFAYLHARAGSVSFKVFGGIMLGISFVLLNNLAGHLGLLRDWTPWIAAATPSALYLLMSLAAFAWLVRYR
jgi:lipopolysaccharide export system permease protein